MAHGRNLTCAPRSRKSKTHRASCLEVKGSIGTDRIQVVQDNWFLESRDIGSLIRCRCKATLALWKSFAPSCQPLLMLLAGRVQRLESERRLFVCSRLKPQTIIPVRTSAKYLLDAAIINFVAHQMITSASGAIY